MFDLALVKYLAIFSSALFGIIGLLGPTRKKDETLTRFGYVAIAGVLLSSAIAGYAQYLTDQSKIAADRARETQLAQDMVWQRHTLEDIRRQLFAIDKWVLSVEATYPTDRPSKLSRYVKQWDEYIARQHANPRKETTPYTVILVDHRSLLMFRTGPHGEKTDVKLDISPQSSLYPPSLVPGAFPGRILEYSDYELFVGDPQALSPPYRCPATDGNTGTMENAMRKKSDLEVAFFLIKMTEGAMVFEYSPEKHIVAVRTSFNKGSIQIAHQPLGIQDLAGKRVLLVSDAPQGRITGVSLRLEKSGQFDLSREHYYKSPDAVSACGGTGAAFTVRDGDFPIAAGVK